MPDPDEHLDRILWGAREIGEEINKTPQETFYLLQRGLLPAVKVGKHWCTTLRKLRAIFETTTA